MVEEAAWKIRNQSWSRCGNTRMPALTVNEVNCVRQLIRVVPPVFRSLCREEEPVFLFCEKQTGKMGLSPEIK